MNPKSTNNIDRQPRKKAALPPADNNSMKRVPGTDSEEQRALPAERQTLPKVQPPRVELPVTTDKNGHLSLTEAGSRKLRRAFLGSAPQSEPPPESDSILEKTLLVQLSGTTAVSEGRFESTSGLNFALQAVASLAPRDGLEAMLCSQLVALHTQSLEYLRRGMLPTQSTDGVDCSVNRATKLLRTFAMLAECLRTYRGGGQQKVTVEHVTVQAGGQAIVGTVNRGAGGGDAQQTCE